MRLRSEDPEILLKGTTSYFDNQCICIRTNVELFSWKNPSNSIAWYFVSTRIYKERKPKTSTLLFWKKKIENSDSSKLLVIRSRRRRKIQKRYENVLKSSNNERERRTQYHSKFYSKEKRWKESSCIKEWRRLDQSWHVLIRHNKVLTSLTGGYYSRFLMIH